MTMTDQKGFALPAQGVSVGMVDSNFRSVDEHGDTIYCTRIVYKYSFYSPANEKMGFNIENNRTFNESQI
jgi:hypothetical protein